MNIKNVVLILYNSFRFQYLGIASRKRIHYKGRSLASPFLKIISKDQSSIRIGSVFNAEHGVYISAKEHGTIIINNNVYINRNTIISCREKIEIGSNVTIGPNVCIFDHDHDIHNIGNYVKSEVIIEDNVWIGAGVIILKGVHIGCGSVIAASSVVLNDVPPKSLVHEKMNNSIIKLQ